MSKLRHAGKPLLYIDQPNRQTPIAKMQSKYQSNRKVKTKSKDLFASEKKDEYIKPTEKKHTVFHDQLQQKSRKNPFLQQQRESELDDTSEELEFDQSDSSKSPEQHDNIDILTFTDDDQTEDITSKITVDEQEHIRTKPFKELSLEGKVDYFLNKPSYVPRLHCEIETNKSTYRGFIVDFKDKQIYVKNRNKKALQNIAYDSITDIKLLGF